MTFGCVVIEDPIAHVVSACGLACMYLFLGVERPVVGPPTRILRVNRCGTAHAS